MAPTLRLYEDILTNDAVAEYPAAPRMIFVVHGAVSLRERNLRDEETLASEHALTLTAAKSGATLWRWDLTGEAGAASVAGAGVVSREKLAARLDTLPAGALLLRGDSVAFPPGGCAYRHRHQGPGIRCLSEGGIRIDTHGQSTSYGPGGAWYETGPDGVFAQAADRPTRFIRVMILPRAYLGKSSVEYLNEEDKAKPKSQSYKIFVDMPLAFEASR
ncbi:MAG TPA: hypothetical protein VMC05_03990 [Xanthobacteraceae bacterium]|nr:hypothetical protein [Xanthobacteraceae bacterium]